MRLFKALLLLTIATVLFSCNKDDNNSKTKIEDYAVQAPKDDIALNKFFDEYHMEVSTDGNFDVSFVKIPSPNVDNLQTIRQEFNPSSKTVKFKDVDHKLYYISLQEGIDKRPCAVDSVFAAYKVEYLYTKKEEILPTTDPKTYIEYIANEETERAEYPIWFQLGNTIKGWQEIFPLFKTGGHTLNSDGSIDYNDFGAGVMFLPSAFGYYSSGQGNIPAYSPLVFNFRLMKLNYMDHDYDRIDSRFEDANGNGDFSDDDTDGDKIPDYLDRDDDGDGYLTKYEIKNPLGGYYPFNGAASDDINTPVDERDGIPDCSGNTTSPTRKRRHLDKTCHQVIP